MRMSQITGVELGVELAIVRLELLELLTRPRDRIPFVAGDFGL
jgi:hypothetical protein